MLTINAHAAPGKVSVTRFHQHLNGIDEYIQFTVEEERCRLPFLNVLMEHYLDGLTQTSVFCKETHTDRYLDFSISPPPSHKKSVVNTLLKCTRDLSYNDCTKEETHGISMLKDNSYPKGFIKWSAQPLPLPPTHCTLKRTTQTDNQWWFYHTFEAYQKPSKGFWRSMRSVWDSDQTRHSNSSLSSRRILSHWTNRIGY